MFQTWNKCIKTVHEKKGKEQEDLICLVVCLMGWGKGLERMEAEFGVFCFFSVFILVSLSKLFYGTKYFFNHDCRFVVFFDIRGKEK